MGEGQTSRDYRGTWKDWPFIAAGVVALLMFFGSMSGGRIGFAPVVLFWGLVLTGLIRGGTFSSRRR
jgi:hypothetical protein